MASLLAPLPLAVAMGEVGTKLHTLSWVERCDMPDGEACPHAAAADSATLAGPASHNACHS